ncbi:autotransporter outer membrane beta-barrel domain-containing protein [Sphingomonas ginsenosidivorax]|uniref:Autotransporter outer membrane beta-barrel domain-containing protein n=1 Tax=Sphingomonas ginsenosidivorax TaxID=862135 RepID=A0A5C6UD99_9SPHN|nr:autotransporter outer membrane beta-barrel domain-containing protein [Sphingomonas ginsenosidivorax]TXC70624.1 autotransporter outer membrane beta-barrel domain-containing protein [Sphingomonas ginsenosidivorax]
MRRLLLTTTCLFAVAAPAYAQTVIDAKRSDPVRTSTVKAGAPDAIRITATGSVVPTAGTAATVDSANAVVNEGTIQISNADNATGLLANAGTGGGITNSGKIILDETYVATDTDKDGDLDGPFAAGSGRTGIRTSGAYAGAIVNSGSVTVQGNNSAGIWLGGPLTGAFTHDGTTSVTGNGSTAVRIADVTGNVRLAGTIAAIGQGAVAARVDGDIAGALVVQGAIGATGYRYVQPPADPSKLDADDLLKGGSALVVAGNISGGIVFAVPPKDASTTDNDEDKDGIEDAKEGSAVITGYGAAPAVQIGAATRAVTIGAVAGTGTGYGLIVDGGIAGSGVYAGIEGNGLAIGGLGGAVTIAGGIGINGTVSATANGASATALRVGRGASTPEIRNAGIIAASGGGTTASRTTAVLVDTGATVGTIRNSGAIRATAQAADGSANGILDRSGSVSLVENSGVISASGALATSERNVAIDLSANNAGVIVRQTAVAAGIAAPGIAGDLRFGAGNDLFDVADGTVAGTARFGAGNNRLALSGDAAMTGGAIFGAGNDTVALAGTSSFAGTADFGGGSDTLTLAGTSRFTGSIANAANLAVAVTGGTLGVTGAASIASLSVGGQGVLAVTLDKTGGTGTLITVAGTASFDKDSKLALRLASITDAEGRYVVLRAGTLTGASNLTATTAVLPFLYKGSIATGTGNDLAVDVLRKTSGELGLNRSEASAYDAIYKALGTDAKVGSSFLNITDAEVFRGSVRQMLPEHAGGTFETVTMGSRAVARSLADPHGPFKDQGNWGYWVTQVGFGTAKSLGDTASYDVSGWGVSAGAEYKTGVGNFGTSIAYLDGRDADGGTANEVNTAQYELAGYWRGHWGDLQANAHVAGARVAFDGMRRFTGAIGSEAVERTARGDWNGTLYSASGGVSWDGGKGRFVFRPVLALDYYTLKEDAYTETGGGKAIDLAVRARSSDELAVTGSAAVGLDFGGLDPERGWFRVEVEGGRRELIGGGLGATTASFDGGEAFTLTPEDRTSGWVGKLRAVGGSEGYRIGGEFNAEQQQGRAALSLRATLQVGL